MLKPTLIVALKPRCYSHAIGEAIASLRSSSLEVRIVEPSELEEQLAAPESAVVLCSQPSHLPTPDGSSSASSGGVRWVEFYPYAEEPEVEIRIDGRAVDTRRGAELEDLVRVIDRLLDEREAGLQQR
jgi:hypothetical protein